MEMERRRRGGGDGGTVVVVVLVGLVMVLGNGVNGDKMYSCFGGCYNECFLRSGKKTGPERLACYYLCLNGCFPRTPADFQYYCQIGCSFRLCLPFSFDGGRLERCFGWCTNLCKFYRI